MASGYVLFIFRIGIALFLQISWGRRGTDRARKESFRDAFPSVDFSVLSDVLNSRLRPREALAGVASVPTGCQRQGQMGGSFERLRPIEARMRVRV